MNSHIRRDVVVAALSVLTLLLLLAPRTVAEAQVAPRFELRARADTVGIRYFAQRAPLTPDGELLFATPSSAQASASSFSGSTGFAGAPYFGPLLTTLPGTINGLAAGALPPFPDTMPGYVTSSFPTDPDPAPQETPGYRVRSSSEPSGTFAEARFGAANEEPAVLASIATAEVRVSDQGSLAEAVARSSPLSVTDLIRVGDVRSVARVEVDPDGTVTKAANLDVGTFTIAGVKVGLTEEGFVLGDQDSLLPSPDLSAIEPVLEAAGVSFEIVPGSETETSITSAGLQISYAVEVPVLGMTETTLILGQVTAAADVQQPVAAPDPVPSSPSVPAPVTPSTPPTSPSPVTAPTPTSPSTGSVSPPTITAPPPAPTVTPPSVAAPSTDTLASTPVAQSRAVAINYGPDGLDFYLVLVLGAAAIFAAGRLTSTLSVRLARAADRGH